MKCTPSSSTPWWAMTLAVLRWVVALAWLLSQGEYILPLPGMKRRSHLQDNLGALKIQLTPDDLAQLSTLSESVQGQRHNPYNLKFIEDS